jgi:predicted dienelactone hydrolase
MGAPTTRWISSGPTRCAQRVVPVRLYLPQSADAQRPVPLVVFSHGIGGSRQGYRYLGSHWASQGYASLHLQHVGSDRNLWFGNVARPDRAPAGRRAGQRGDRRVKDLSFALDQLGAARWRRAWT